MESGRAGRASRIQQRSQELMKVHAIDPAANAPGANIPGARHDQFTFRAEAGSASAQDEKCEFSRAQHLALSALGSVRSRPASREQSDSSALAWVPTDGRQELPFNDTLIEVELE
jgi:hypothetical protein